MHTETKLFTVLLLYEMKYEMMYSLYLFYLHFKKTGGE